MGNKLTKQSMDEKSLDIIGLFTNYYTKQIHVREIGRLLSMNHRTALLHLQQMEKDGILSSKTLGNARQYSINLSNILSKWMLELAETYASSVFLKERFLIKNILVQLEQSNAIEGALILFGSWAKGQESKDSDIDLLVIGRILDEKVIKDVQVRTGKHLSIKVISEQDFSDALFRKDTLVMEIVAAHKTLKQAGLLVDVLWRYYHAR